MLLIAATTRWPKRNEPWSLSELRLGEEQRSAIVDWCATLHESAIARVAAGLGETFDIEDQRVTGQAAYGICLLLAFSEIARRAATEGRLWRCVRTAIDARRASPSPLFDSGGQPTATTKQLLERGARRFGVRHAFDLTDNEGSGHHWYTTVYLQFGITRRGFEQNAAYWLRNQNLSRTIQLLLDREGVATGHGRPLYSRDFEEMWVKLVLGARKNLAGDALRRALSAFQWLPAEDVDGFATVVEDIDWSALGDDSAAIPAEELEQIDDSFIGQHRWVRFDDGPGVVVELSGLANLELEEDYYDVFLDGRRAARLLTNSESLLLIPLQNHGAAGATLAFRLPSPLRPIQRSTLVDPQGQVRAAQDLQLWSTDDVVRTVPLFDKADGESSRESFVVIADAAATPPSSDIEQFTLDDGRYFCFVHEEDDPSEVELEVGDDKVRPSNVESAGSAASRGQYAFDVTMHGHRAGGGSRSVAEVTLHTPAGIQLSSVWNGQNRLAALSRPDGSARLEVTLSATSYELDLLLISRRSQGGLVTKRLRIPLPLSGLFRIQGGKTERCPATRNVTRRGIEEGRYIFLPDSDVDGDPAERTEWTLFESSTPLRRMPTRGQPRLTPSGLGWPLLARYRPVNTGKQSQLCNAIVDFGDLRPGHDLTTTKNGEILLGLSDNLIDELEAYSLVVWDKEGSVLSGKLTEVEKSANGYTTVRGCVEGMISSPVCIGLHYRGYRAGAIWTSDWYTHLPNLVARGASRAAAFVRWFKLPVATQGSLDAIRRCLLAHHAVELIRGFIRPMQIDTDDSGQAVLLTDAGLIQPGALDTPWYVALRDVIDDWLPTPEAVDTFVDALIPEHGGTPHESSPLTMSLANTVRISPRLAVGTGARYAQSLGGSEFQRRILEELAMHLAEASSDREFWASNDLLLEQAAGTLGSILRQPIDPAFVDSLLERALQPDSWFGGAWSPNGTNQNLPHFCDSELLCHFPDGRRLLAMHGARRAAGL